MDNKELAKLLFSVADYLELNLDNPYRIKAYRRAARSIEKLEKSVTQMVNAGDDITQIHYVGQRIASHIKEIVTRGELPPIKPRQSRFNKNYLEKKERFYKFKFVKKTIDYIELHCANIKEINKCAGAGSFRRKCEIVGNIDFIIATTNPKKVYQQLLNLSIVDKVASESTNQYILILFSGMIIFLHFVTDEDYAYHLLLLTGSSKHLEELKQLAAKKRFTLKDGLYRNRKKILTPSESVIYESLGLCYIEPELREGEGEIKASQKNRLPKLINLEDIKGDLHSHTNETDGIEPMYVMVEAAIKKGYEYLAITDHSKRLTITNGLDEKRLLKQLELIDELNSKYTNITILKSIEVDILEDGSLDLSDEVLKLLDIRVCSIHSKFKLSAEKQTERILRAMENPYFNILGHPTGRLIQYRPAYPILLDKILVKAKENNCFLELNAQPSRLDLKDIYCKMVKEHGVKLAISTDAHSTREFDFMEFGIDQARRGWLEKSDVINTLTLTELKKVLKK